MQTTRAAERSVFGVSGRTFRWDDVVRAAMAWGPWNGCVQDARDARRALEWAEREGVPLEGAEFDAEEERFRRSRRLLAADELVAWLARREVDVSEWRDYVRGVVLRRRGVAECRGDADPGRAVWVHAVCSGALDSVALKLAGRVAAASAVGLPGPSEGPLTGPELARLEQAFEEFCERMATSTAIEREIERHRLDWTMFEWRFQATGDHDVLREAALCIREDGLAFEGAAAAAGVTVQHRRANLDDIDPDLQSHLLAARVGELIGPLTLGSEYCLIEVLDKRTPSSEDPEVWARARSAVLNRAVEAELVDRVRWDERV